MADEPLDSRFTPPVPDASPMGPRSRSAGSPPVRTGQVWDAQPLDDERASPVAGQ